MFILKGVIYPKDTNLSPHISSKGGIWASWCLWHTQLLCAPAGGNGWSSILYLQTCWSAGGDLASQPRGSASDGHTPLRSRARVQ